MLEAKSKYDAQMEKERSLADYIPYSTHISEDVVITKSGDLVRCWKVKGISFETAEEEDIAIRKDQFNTCLRSIGSQNVAIWTHNVRQLVQDSMKFPDDGSYAKAYNDDYYRTFDNFQMFENSLYLTVVYRPYGRDTLGLGKFSKRKRAEIDEARAESLKKFDEIALQIEASMRRYGLERQGIYEHKGVAYSQLAEFWHFLASGEHQRIRLSDGINIGVKVYHLLV